MVATIKDINEIFQDIISVTDNVFTLNNRARPKIHEETEFYDLY